MANAQVKKGCWVLTNEHNDYDQHGRYFLAMWAEQPTMEQLAEWFKNQEGLPNNVMEAVAFLEKLRAGKDAPMHNNQVHYHLKFERFSG